MLTLDDLRSLALAPTGTEEATCRDGLSARSTAGHRR
jgi:hypothetical protein